MSSPGWFPDPSGRFGQRWYDGTLWSEHVVSATGQPVVDPLPGAAQAPPDPTSEPEPAPEATPASDDDTSDDGLGPATSPADEATTFKRPAGLPSAPAAPPPASQPPAPPQQQWPANPAGGYPPAGPYPGGAPYGGAPYPGGASYPGATGPRARYAPGIGLAVGLVGVVIVALSLFVLNWVDGDKSTFLDFAEAARDANTDGADFAPTLAIAYGAWAAFVLFGLTVVAVLAAGIPIPTSSDKVQRIVGALIAGIAAVLNTVTFTQIDKGADLQVGGYVGTAGYLVVAVGFVIGARRVDPRPYPPR